MNQTLTMLATIGKSTTKAMIHYANQGGKTKVVPETTAGLLLFFIIAAAVCTYLYISRSYKLCEVATELRTPKARIAAYAPGVFGVVAALVSLILLNTLT